MTMRKGQNDVLQALGKQFFFFVFCDTNLCFIVYTACDLRNTGQREGWKAMVIRKTKQCPLGSR